MSTFITIIVVVFAFSFLVFIHELGHFLMAKRAGIKVIEFAIGFPPRIFSRKKGETTYSINAIPFGGYVRLYGEDAADPKVLKSKKSFASKPLRQRIYVVIGGVIMNFITALLLFTIGFSIGMKPILPTSDDPLNNGLIEVQSGAIIKSISEESPLNEFKIQPKTQILQINNKPIEDYSNLDQFLKDKPEIKSLQVLQDTKEQKIEFTSPQTKLGIELYPLQTQFPRLKIQDIKPNTSSIQSGLQKDDIIIEINDLEITNIDQYNQIIQSTTEANYTILRNHRTLDIKVPFPPKNSVIINTVFDNTPAQKEGIKKGDIITEINGEQPLSAQQAVELIHQDPNKTHIVLKRQTQLLTIDTPLENKTLGISPRTIYNYDNQHLTLYLANVPTSITKVNDLQYPVHIAAIKSLELMKDLSKTTASGFINLIKSVATSFEVPNDVGGAVALTAMIHQSVQSGPTDVLQLIAYISLVLAVLNILPLPALDGGRLLFLVIEAITGKKIKPQWEAYIHTIGFILLLLLIILINYTDITRLI